MIQRLIFNACLTLLAIGLAGAAGCGGGSDETEVAQADSGGGNAAQPPGASEPAGPSASGSDDSVSGQESVQPSGGETHGGETYAGETYGGGAQSGSPLGGGPQGSGSGYTGMGSPSFGSGASGYGSGSYGLSRPGFGQPGFSNSQAIRPLVLGPAAPSFGQRGIELPWVHIEDNFDDESRAFPSRRVSPLSAQQHRVVKELQHAVEAAIPVSNPERFDQAIAEMGRKWTSNGLRTSGTANRRGLDEIARDQDMFEEMIGDADSITDLARSLQSDARYPSLLNTRVHALGLFGEHASEAVPTIVELIKNPPHMNPMELSRWRMHCAQALANIGPASEAELKDLLSGGTATEKRFAVAVVGLLGDKAVDCVPELIELLDDEDIEMVNAALWGLAAIGPGASAAVPKVTHLIEERDDLAFEKAAMLHAAGSVALDSVLELVQGEITPQRIPLIYVVGRFAEHQPQAIPTLIGFLDHPDVNVQQAGITAMAGLGDAAQPAIATLIQQLNGPNALVAIKVFAAIGSVAAPAVPELCQMAVSPLEERLPAGQQRIALGRRIAAIDAIGRIGHADPQSIKKLARLMREPRQYGAGNWTVRGHAARTLGLLGEKATVAIPPLASAVKDPVDGDRRFGQRAFEFDVSLRVGSLGQIGSGAANLELVALQSLGKIGEDSDIVLDACKESLSHADPAMRVVAAKSLLHLGHPPDDIVDILTAAMREAASTRVSNLPSFHSDELVMHLAAETLSAVDETATDELLEFVQSLEGETRTLGVLNRCLLVLGKLGVDSEEVQLYLIKLSLEVPGKDQHTIAYATHAVDSMNLNAATQVQRLLQLLSEEDAPTGPIVEALGKLGREAAPGVPQLSSLLESESGEVRTQVVYALRAIGPEVEGVIPALLSILEDDDHKIQIAAFEGLCRFGPAAAPHAKSLVDYARKRPTDFFAQSSHDLSVTQALPRIGGEAILPVLLPNLAEDKASQTLLQKLQWHLEGEETVKLLVQYLDDPNVEVRRSVTTCLLGMGADARPAVAQLKEAVRDKDPTVAWQAATALLHLISIDELLESQPVAEGDPPTRDFVERLVEGLVEQMLPPNRPSKETLQLLREEKQKPRLGHWLQLLEDPDPHVRFAIGMGMFGYRELRQDLLKSVINDPRTKAEVKQLAEKMLSRQR